MQRRLDSARPVEVQFYESLTLVQVQVMSQQALGASCHLTSGNRHPVLQDLRLAPSLSTSVLVPLEPATVCTILAKLLDWESFFSLPVTCYNHCARLGKMRKRQKWLLEYKYP